MDIPVSKIMTTRLITISPEDSVDKAFRACRKHDLGHLPVVAADNKDILIGIITRSDLIKAYDRQLIPTDSHKT
jgi:CIC family chloride channel protein